MWPRQRTAPGKCTTVALETRNSPGEPGLLTVARAGLEPATFHFSGERYYQLSYLAVLLCWMFQHKSGDETITASATPTGLEPATSAVTGRRANQLRYGALWAQRLAVSVRQLEKLYRQWW